MQFEYCIISASLCKQKEQCGIFLHTQVLIAAAVFIGLHNDDCCGCFGHGGCGKSCAVSEPVHPSPRWSQSQAMAGLKVHVYVCSADAVLSSGSLCWDPWLWILYNHFSTGFVSRTVLSYPPRKKLDLSFHWLLWRVSCLFMRMLSLPDVHMGRVYSSTFQQCSVTIYQNLFITLSFPIWT